MAPALWQICAGIWQTGGRAPDRGRLASAGEQNGAMIMLVAHVTFTVSAADRERVLQRLAADAAAVRAMPGCLAFVPFADPTAADRLGVMHEWTSAEEFGRYAASPLFARFGADVRPLMAAPPISRRFAATLVDMVN